MKGGNRKVYHFPKNLFRIDNKYFSIEQNDKEGINLATVINYQLSMFGKFSISPTPETISILMPKINEKTEQIFLPNLISSQQIEIPANRVTTISNLGFVTQDQRFNISILNERIDVTYNRSNDIDISMQDFYALALNAFTAIFENAAAVSNRLALNIQAVCEMESFDKMKSKGKDLLKSAAFYTEKPLVEWSMRTNSQENIQLNESDELVNYITEVSSAQDVTGQKAAVLFHIDINTVPKNTNIRFNTCALDQFVEIVTPIAQRIWDDVERLIRGE